MPASESMVVWFWGTGLLSSQRITDSGWSSRFSPTPGRSRTTGMLRFWSCSLGPRPESVLGAVLEGDVATLDLGAGDVELADPGVGQDGQVWPLLLAAEDRVDVGHGRTA